jgi:hypothetical protein
MLRLVDLQSLAERIRELEIVRQSKTQAASKVPTSFILKENQGGEK